MHIVEIMHLAKNKDNDLGQIFVRFNDEPDFNQLLRCSCNFDRYGTDCLD